MELFMKVILNFLLTMILINAFSLSAMVPKGDTLKIDLTKYSRSTFDNLTGIALRESSPLTDKWNIEDLKITFTLQELQKVKNLIKEFLSLKDEALIQHALKQIIGQRNELLIKNARPFLEVLLLKVEGAIILHEKSGKNVAIVPVLKVPAKPIAKQVIPAQSKEDKELERVLKISKLEYEIAQIDKKLEAAKKAKASKK